MPGDEDPKLLALPKGGGGSDSSRTTAPWEISTHPLYIHYSDQPSAKLVSQILVEDNYMNWVQSMEMALTIKNKKGFVDGSLTRSQHNPDEQTQWDRCNTLVKTWLLGAMSKEISDSVIHCKDAAGMWLELKERFSQINTVALFQVEAAIHGCEQGTATVTSFFTKLKALWDEKDALSTFPACSCDAAPEVKKLLETQKTIKFLMGLNEDFGQIRSTIISIDPLPKLNKAYAMVLRQEKQAEARVQAIFLSHRAKLSLEKE